jgi:hypothetical protein
VSFDSLGLRSLTQKQEFSLEDILQSTEKIIPQPEVAADTTESERGQLGAAQQLGGAGLAGQAGANRVRCGGGHGHGMGWARPMNALASTLGSIIEYALVLLCGGRLEAAAHATKAARTQPADDASV